MFLFDSNADITREMVAHRTLIEKIRLLVSENEV